MLKIKRKVLGCHHCFVMTAWRPRTSMSSGQPYQLIPNCAHESIRKPSWSEHRIWQASGTFTLLWCCWARGLLCPNTTKTLYTGEKIGHDWTFGQVGDGFLEYTTLHGVTRGEENVPWRVNRWKSAECASCLGGPRPPPSHILPSAPLHRSFDWRGWGPDR